MDGDGTVRLGLEMQRAEDRWNGMDGERGWWMAGLDLDLDLMCLWLWVGGWRDGDAEGVM